MFLNSPSSRQEGTLQLQGRLVVKGCLCGAGVSTRVCWFTWGGERTAHKEHYRESEIQIDRFIPYESICISTSLLKRSFSWQGAFTPFCRSVSGRIPDVQFSERFSNMTGALRLFLSVGPYPDSPANEDEGEQTHRC